MIYLATLYPTFIAKGEQNLKMNNNRADLYPRALKNTSQYMIILLNTNIKTEHEYLARMSVFYFKTETKN